jgi:uncharacterized protein (UPF0332 family)
MPTKAEHIAQARHNRSFWASFPLDSTPFPDWVVNGIFYEGVHWAEAFLSTRGEHSDTHGQRLAALQRNKTEMGQIIADLDILKQESENARYRCYRHTPTDITNDLVPVIDEIRKHTETFLQSSSSTP